MRAKKEESCGTLSGDLIETSSPSPKQIKREKGLSISRTITVKKLLIYRKNLFVYKWVKGALYFTLRPFSGLLK
jgi:hypothetical protein